MKQHKFNSGGGYDTVVVFCELCGQVSYDNGLTIDENIVLQEAALKGCTCNEGYLVPATLESINPLENVHYTPAPIPGTEKLEQFFNAGRPIFAGDLIPGPDKTRPLPGKQGPGKPKTSKYRDTADYPVEKGERIYVPKKMAFSWEPEERIFTNTATYENGFYCYLGLCKEACDKLTEIDNQE